MARFRRRVLRPHAAGVSPAVSDRVARPALVLRELVLRANTMARGATGVRPGFVDRILDLVDAGATTHDERRIPAEVEAARVTRALICGPVG